MPRANILEHTQVCGCYGEIGLCHGQVLQTTDRSIGEAGNALGITFPSLASKRRGHTVGSTGLFTGLSAWHAVNKGEVFLASITGFRQPAGYDGLARPAHTSSWLTPESTLWAWIHGL